VIPHQVSLDDFRLLVGCQLMKYLSELPPS